VSIEAASTRISHIQSQILALQAFTPVSQVARASTRAAAETSASGSFASHLSKAMATQSPKTYR
jgi:hypothetical protein